MGDLLFRNVKIVDPGSPHNRKKKDIRIKNGKINRIDKAGSIRKSAKDKVIEGGSISSGWIDLRVHLSDPGEEWKDDLRSLAASAVAGGFTTIVCLPNTHPVVDGRDIVESIRSRSSNLPVNVLVAGALTAGTEGKDLAELYDMKLAGAVAFTDGVKPVTEAGVMLRGLQYAASFDGLLMSFPMDISIAGDAQVNEGKSAARIGMKGSPTIAEEMQISRDLRLHQYFPGRLHFGPVTTGGGIDLIRASKRKSEQITSETSAHYLVFDDTAIETFDVNRKLFPPLRNKRDVKSIRKAVNDGVIDAISSGHWPQADEDKKVEFAQAAYGMIGLQTAFTMLNTHLVASKELSIDRLIECFTSGPRKVLGLPAIRIEEGSEIDLTHFDEKVSWTLEKSEIKSRSKNSPLIGESLIGRALGTVTGGKYHES